MESIQMLDFRIHSMRALYSVLNVAPIFEDLSDVLSSYA
jgi:hypothetical protein